MVHLVKPTTKYKKSYLAALKEFHQEGRFWDVKRKEATQDFASFVSKLKSRAQGKYLPPKMQPEFEYWLVDGRDFIGRVCLRRRLNNKRLKREVGHIGYEIRPSKRKRDYGKKALKLALAKAKMLGLKNILLICKMTNIGSRKIIEHWGG